MRYLAIIVSFLITAFGQPAWVPGFGVFAAAFGYALFWMGMLQFDRAVFRFALASFWYASVQGVQFSWLATTDYMSGFIIPFYLFVISAIGLQFGILSSFIVRPKSFDQNLLIKDLAIAGGWVLCEWMRLFFLCGCTWNLTGIALASSPYSLQLAAVWGIFGLSFWVILVNLLLLEKRFIAWSCLAVFPYLFGFVHQTWIEKTVPISKTFHVALVQTDLAPEEKELYPQSPKAYIHPFNQWENALNLLSKHTENGEERIDLIVFPEAAFPTGAYTATYELASAKRLMDETFFPPLKPPYAIFYRGSWKVSNAFFAQTLANQTKAHVIIGLDDKDLNGKYNAAFHFYPNQFVAHPKRYEKQILAPIGEYIPLTGVQWFAEFVEKQFSVYSSFQHGKEGKIFYAKVPIGISICLEETFPSLIRSLRLKGAELLVSVSNDAYFPKTKLGLQHLDHGRIRAIENGVGLLRSCNSGVTAGIDCFGKPLKILESHKADVLLLKFPLRSYKTLYTFWGDSAILGLSFFFVFFFLLLPRKKKLL